MESNVRMMAIDLEAYELLVKLCSHLAGTQRVEEVDVFRLKCDLIKLVESNFTAGHMVSLREVSAKAEPLCAENIWALLGKSPDNETVLWHRLLPWPTGISKTFTQQ